MDSRNQVVQIFEEGIYMLCSDLVTVDLHIHATGQ